MPSPFIYLLSATSNNLVNLTRLGTEIESSTIARRPTDIDAIKDFDTGVWTFIISFSPDLTISEEVTLNTVVADHDGSETLAEAAVTVGLTAADIGVPGGIPSLDGGGKIPVSALPAQSIPSVSVVPDAASRLGLVVEEGDEAIQTDDGSNWIYDGTTWYPRPIGSGDVVGPTSSINNTIPRFDGISGKVIKSGQIAEDNSGNLTTGGTVNGRDISVDGAKLDGIEVGASADQIAAEVPFTANGDISATNIQSAIVEVRDDTDIKLLNKLNISHEGSGGAAHATATTISSGFLSSGDKSKLDGIESGAESNDVDSVFGRIGAVSAQTSDYDADQIDYDNTTSGLAAVDVQTALDEIASSGPGSSTPAQYFSGADVGGGTVIGTTWTDIPIDTEFRKDSIFTHAGSSSEVTVTQTDTYLLVADVTTRVSSGNNRSQVEMRVLLNGFELLGTRAGMYARELNEGTNSGSVTRVVNLSAGDVVKMQAERTSGVSNIEALPNGSRLNLILTRGEKGVPGVSGIELQQNSIPVAGGPFATVDIIGPNNTIIDQGAGIASVDTTPERFYSENNAQQDTGSGTLSPALTLNFTASGGVYDVEWYFEAKNATVDSVTRTSVTLDGSTVAFADIFIGSDVTIEVPSCGFVQSTLLPGPHTLIINWALLSGASAQIRRTRLRVKKVGI